MLRTEAKTADYVTVIAMIWVSASAVLFVHYEAKMTLFVLWSVAYFLWRPKLQPQGVLSLAILLVLIGSTLIVLLLNPEPNLSPYSTTVTLLCVGYGLNWVLPFAVFANVYVNVVTYLSAISLAFWAIGLRVPALIARLPLAEGEVHNYADAFVHVFVISTQPGAEGEIQDRNSGMAWEPAAFAILVALAVALLLCRVQSSGVQRGDAIRLLLFVGAVLSTFSFTGLFCLAVLLASFRRALLAVLRSAPALARIGTLFLAVGLWLAILELRASDRYSGGVSDVLSRLSLERVDSLQLTPWFMFGSSFSTMDATELPIWNSILYSLITLGWIFTIVLGLTYWRFALLFRPNSLSVALVLLASFSTENFFISALFIFCAFAGVMQSARQDEGTPVLGVGIEDSSSPGFGDGPVGASKHRTRSRWRASRGRRNETAFEADGLAK